MRFSQWKNYHCELIKVGNNILRRVKLRPWPFKRDEEVELFWICSPYLNKEHNWMFKAVFKKSNNTVEEIELPWGILPNLTIGQVYKNGLPEDSKKVGIMQELDISYFNSYEICSSFDMPYDLYYLYKNSHYGKQKVCKFTIKNQVYYLPCIEVIRAFLTPSKVLAYQLLKPHGLQALVESISYPYEHVARINLTNEFPLKLANDDNIMHLLWLMTDKYTKITWDYVYKNLYKRASFTSHNNPHNALAEGIPLEARPPYMEKCKLAFRGITKGKNTLILEINSILGLQLQYHFIYYNHPSFLKLKKVNEAKTSRRIGKKEESDFELDDSQQSTKKQSDPSTIDNAKLKFGFDGIHFIRKSKQLAGHQRTGKHEGDNIIESGAVNNTTIVGAQDWAYGSEIKPIEFKLINVEFTTSTKGLEDFIMAINYINANYKDLDIQFNIALLPEGKSFSYYPNGHRRACAVVKVNRKEQLPRYIIEVVRLDNWSISTLLIFPLSFSTIENEGGILIDKMLNGLMNNNGHWDKSLMYQGQEYKFDMMKHVTNQGIGRWGKRIVSRII